MIYGGYWSCTNSINRGPEAFPKPKLPIDENLLKFGNEIPEINTEKKINSETFNGFCLSYKIFEIQTNLLEAHTPEEAIVRCMLLNYFWSQSNTENSEGDPIPTILNFEEQFGSFSVDENTSLLLRSLFSKLGWKYTGITELFTNYFPVGYNFPEVIRFFYVKLFTQPFPVEGICKHCNSCKNVPHTQNEVFILHYPM
jgi:hypothetical protein